MTIVNPDIYFMKYIPRMMWGIHINFDISSFAKPKKNYLILIYFMKYIPRMMWGIHINFDISSFAKPKKIITKKKIFIIIPSTIMSNFSYCEI